MIKIGLIGLGNQSQENLLPALAEAEGIILQSICSRDRNKAEKIASLYNVPNIYDTESTFKNNDAVIICATPDIHFQLFNQFKDLRTPIFLEKPPVYNINEYEKILDIIEKYKIIVGFGLNFKHANFYKKLSEETNNFSNNIRYMKIKSYAAKPNLPIWNCSTILESSLLSSHIHAIDMLCYSIDEDIDTIKSSICWLDDTRFVLNIILEFKNSKVGALELSNASNRFEYNVEVASKEHIWTIKDFNTYEKIAVNQDGKTSFAKKSRIIYEEPFLHGGFARTGYKTELENFVKRIKQKKNDERELKSIKQSYKVIKEIINDYK